MRSYASYLRDDAFAIFLLHGVVRRQMHAVRNYTRKHLLLDDFVCFLQELKSVGTAVSMDEIVTAHHQGRRLPKRAFTVTFDDGFENNASVAAPVLNDLGIPAMFYVTTGFVGSDACSWTDRIEAALEQSGTLRLEGLSKEVDGCYVTAQEKISLMDSIRAYVKSNNTLDPYEFAAAVVEQAGVTVHPFDHDLDAKLGWGQLRLLAEHPLFSVGGHSHTHRILSFLADEDLEEEISTSIRLLAEATGREIAHYSYPEGMAHCYSEKVIATLKRRRIVCSPTAEEGINSVGDSLFHLKRVLVI